MNKKGSLSVGQIVVFFMGIIISVAFLPQIFDTQNLMTDKQAIVDEAIDISPARLANGDINETYEFTVTNAPDGWKTTECPLESVVYGNSSDDYTVTTDYLITASSGVLTVVNTTVTVEGGNNTVIDYAYCADGYNTSSGARGVAGIIGLFAVMILLGFGIFYLRESGVMDNFN